VYIDAMAGPAAGRRQPAHGSRTADAGWWGRSPLMRFAKDRKIARSRCDEDAAYAAYAEPCACGCSATAEERRSIRASFLDLILEDPEPTGPVWYSMPGDPDLLFSYLPDRMSDPGHTR
jgi:hypothetical protein